MVAGCVPAWVDVSVELFHHGGNMCSRMGGSKCRALSSWLQDVFLHGCMVLMVVGCVLEWLNVSAGPF